MLVNNTLSKIIIFAAGAAVGSGVTYLIVKDICDKKAQAEIDKVVEDFMHREVEATVEEVYEEPVEAEGQEVNEQDEYDEIVKNEGYVAYGNDRSNKKEGYVAYGNDRSNKKEEKNDMKRPYVIEPEDFGEEGYPTVSLWYFEGDEVLTDNHQRKIIRNVDELVGEDFAEHFGEYEDDSVFIRNDELEVDYEILRDERSFSELK